MANSTPFWNQEHCICMYFPPPPQKKEAYRNLMEYRSSATNDVILAVVLLLTFKGMSEYLVFPIRRKKHFNHAFSQRGCRWY